MASPGVQAAENSKKRGREEEAPPAQPKHSTFTLSRITKELRDAKSRNLREELNMEVELVDDADVTRWRIKWFYDHASKPDATETQRRLAEQLAERKLEFIEFRMVFPVDYPGEAPFFYNHYPHLKGCYVFTHGGICAEALSTKHGWSPAQRAYVVANAVRGLLEAEGCRLKSENEYSCKRAMLVPNDEENAARDKSAIEIFHSSGWHGSKGRS